MEGDQKSSVGPRFDADQPIESRDRDLLGRTPFAEGIARDLATVPADKGFTAAVVGEWGTGKTSVLNMVEETLKSESPETVVLRFNPWLFGGAHDLLIRFFSELGAQLGQSGAVSIKTVVGALLEFGAAAAPLSTVPGASPLATVLRLVAKRLGRPQSLLDQHNKLKEVLAKLDCRIVVVIDDIDRLESGETRELIRLVRLTSDLPNMIFLLAFDWRHVAESLAGAGEDGSAYLDKIVQVRYDLPMIRSSALRKELFDSLNKVLGGYEHLPLDQGVWERVFYDVVGPVIATLRDARRYVNSLPVALNAVGQEVALADLLGLEVIRVLRPTTFELLKSNATYLVHPVSLAAQVKSVQERTTVLKNMLDAERDPPPVLRALLAILFPATEEALGGMTHGPGWDDQWRRDRRVACEEVLRVYLQAGLDEGALEYSTVSRLVATLTDGDALERLLEELNADELEEALDRLEDYQEKLPQEAIPIAVPVLANLMHKLSDTATAPTFFNFSPRIKARRVIWVLLRQVRDPHVLRDLLNEAWDKIDNLSGHLEIMEIIGGPKPNGTIAISENDAEMFFERLVDELSNASTEELRTEWNLGVLIMRTWSWMSDEGKNAFEMKVRGHLVDNRFLVQLLLTSIGRISGTRRDEVTLAWDNLTNVFGADLIDTLRRLLSSPIYGELEEQEKKIVDLAQTYANGYRPRMW